MSENMTTPERWEELKHFFAKYPYFQVAIDALKEKGYRFLAKIQVDSTQFPYHVSIEAARVTSIFMTMPHKAVVIQLVFTENFEVGGEHWIDGQHIDLNQNDPRLYRCHWAIRIHYSHCWRAHYRKFLEEFDETGLTFWDMDDVREQRWQEARCLKEADQSIMHTFGTGHYEQLCGGQQRLDPKIVAEFAHERIAHLLPWLYPGFLRLDVFNFAPYNVFGGAMLDWLWGEFPLSRLVEYGICREYEGHDYRPTRW